MTAPGSQLDLAALFGPPERDNARLAPDGRRVAWLAAPDGVPDLWVADLVDQADLAGLRPRRVTRSEPPGIALYCWSPNGHDLLYVVDDAGDENWRLHAVDATGGPARPLTPAGVQADVLALSWHHAGHILVSLDARAPGCPDAYRLDLATGDLERVATNPGAVERWLADPRQRVRVATERTPDGGAVVLHRPGGGGPWTAVARLAPDDALASGPVAALDDGVVLVSTDGADTARLMLLDPATGGWEVLAERPGADVDDLLLDPRTHRPQAVAFATDRRSWLALDPGVADDLVAADRLHPGDMKVVDRDSADRHWLVRHTGPDVPGTYHLWDRANRVGRHLLDQQPALTPASLATTRAFTCTARDGLSLHGYWTPPRGRPPHPAVVLVHGGPWWRDGWEWEPEVQWLADRGYGCLRVNFRGSSGWGKAFAAAGNRQWGAAMQDDLLDALDHAVAAGWVDPGLVAIMGSSYGGYAALVAATTSSRFRCAVSFAGPTDLVEFLRSVPEVPPSARRLWWSRVGDPDDPADAERLRRHSPVTRAAEVAVPVLLGQGANDPRVTRVGSDRFVAVARSAGASVDYHVYPGEGHGLAHADNAVHFRAAVGRFLAQHVPTGA